MLKAMARTEHGAMILIGLSHANVDRLMAGQPIMFPGDSIGMEKEIDKVYIFAAKDEAEMQHEMEKRGLIGPATKITNEAKGAEYVRRTP